LELLKQESIFRRSASTLPWAIKRSIQGCDKSAARRWNLSRGIRKGRGREGFLSSREEQRGLIRAFTEA
jgi:hypothetical protein